MLLWCFSSKVYCIPLFSKLMERKFSYLSFLSYLLRPLIKRDRLILLNHSILVCLAILPGYNKCINRSLQCRKKVVYRIGQAEMFSRSYSKRSYFQWCVDVTDDIGQSHWTLLGVLGHPGIFLVGGEVRLMDHFFRSWGGLWGLLHLCLVSWESSLGVILPGIPE